MLFQKKKIIEQESDKPTEEELLKGIRVGDTIFKQFNYREAIEAFKQAITLNPKDSDAYFELGINLINLYRYKEAIEAFKKAIDLDPVNPLFYCALAESYKRIGEEEEALKAFKQSIPLSKDYIGEEEEVIENYKQNIALYNNKNIKEKLVELQNYWPFFLGLPFGGFFTILTLVIVSANEGAVNFTQGDIYFSFFGGALFLGWFFGWIFQDIKSKAQERKKNNRYSYNKEYIIINDSSSPRQREASKKYWYKTQGSIHHYEDELTPSEIKKIQERDREISKIKERLED